MDRLSQQAKGALLMILGTLLLLLAFADALGLLPWP